MTAEDVQEVFSDIRADHPGQPYVTLEQSVRRIEGLARGVPLSESARLVSEFPSVHTAAYDPSGKVVGALRSLGFLSEHSVPNASEIDAVARKLSESDLSRVLREAYGPASFPASSDAPPSGFPVPETPVSVDENPMPQASEPAASATPDSPPSPGDSVPLAEPAVNFPNFRYLPLALAALAVPFGIAAYRRSRKDAGAEKLSDPAPSVRDSDDVRPPSPVFSESPSPATDSPSEETPVVAPVPKDVPSVLAAPAYPALRHAAADVLSGEYAFATKESEVPGTFVLPTLAGEFLATIDESGDAPRLRFSWYEGRKERFSTFRDLMFSGDPGELRATFRSSLEDAYYAAAVFRENAKRQEFREVRIFEISDRDLSSIYRQLEDPATARTNRETGGFWFSSGYSVRDGVFRFRNLANPLPEEIDSTSAEFAIRYEKWETYVGSNVSKAFRIDFSPGERKLFSRALERAAKNPDDPNPFPFAIDFFNWHKHPGAPLGPSHADINHPDSAPGKFADSPSLGTVTFVIANRLEPGNSEKRLWNSHVLRRADYGGSSDYLLTFWKLLRISDEERSRRESFVARVGRPQAAALGICDRDGRILHIDREIRTESGVFSPDLRPVAVRTVPI